MEDKKDLKLAVVIDADNVPYANVKGMMEEIAKYGIPTFKRIYGDWTKPNLAGWKNVLLENAITPIQQYGYTQGKNSTDAALIIDAMDILYTGKVDGFCI
ncbi:MAG: NYN domain-containing protein, partial [Fulvivirga sp.]